MSGRSTRVLSGATGNTRLVVEKSPEMKFGAKSLPADIHLMLEPLQSSYSPTFIPKLPNCIYQKISLSSTTALPQYNPICNVPNGLVKLRSKRTIKQPFQDSIVPLFSLATRSISSFLFWSSQRQPPIPPHHQPSRHLILSSLYIG